MEKQHSLIFLTGFSGSGKSSIGPLLANSLGYDFIDIDSAIEQQAGKSITRIFAEEGEEAFRKLEQAMIATIAESKEMVASLGGGALEHTPSFELINATGTLVYLKSDPKNLAKRLFHKTDRPLLRSVGTEKPDREALERNISEILAKRSPRYETAAIAVYTDQKRIGSTVEELTRKIERFVRKHESIEHNDQQTGRK
ncbi:MAG: shikimate kinase [Chlorobium sp.]|nr:shikimate kinase [Chlorobium phaeovibrioides]NQU45451.1 shikimate kinase [Chlorobium sp.]